jgi:hypothetical protein
MNRMCRLQRSSHARTVSLSIVSKTAPPPDHTAWLSVRLMSERLTEGVWLTHSAPPWLDVRCGAPFASAMTSRTFLQRVFEANVGWRAWDTWP